MPEKNTSGMITYGGFYVVGDDGSYEKLMDVQQTLKAPKNQYNKFGNYHYRSCEDILEGLKEPLSKAKAAVTISDEIVCIADRVYVKATATFIDAETGEKMRTVLMHKNPPTERVWIHLRSLVHHPHIHGNMP